MKMKRFIETGGKQSKGGGNGTSVQPSGGQKFYVDEGTTVTIAEDGVHIMNSDGSHQHKTYIEYVGGKIISLYNSESELRKNWIDQQSRSEIIAELEQFGIERELLEKELQFPDADTFDLFCHVAFGADLQTREQRAQRVRTETDFLNQYTPLGQFVLGALLDKYSQHGPEELKIPDALRVPPISEFGNIREILKVFKGADQLRNAVKKLQKLIYEA